MNLSERGELIGFLRRHGLSPEKSLGQHFLCSSKVTSAITSAVGDVASVLEIGPGPGTLTSALAKKWPITAIEIDERMVPVLVESAPTANVILEDVLKCDLGAILATIRSKTDPPGAIAVVSNMPYNITGPLLGRISGASDLWDVAVLMMQREVGQKVLAKPGDRVRGAISVRMQAEFEIVKVCDVPPGAFLPPPKVDSIVLKLTPKRQSHPVSLFKVVQAGFTQPRKTVANNLFASGYSRDLVEVAGLPASVRPHQLTHEDWLKLCSEAELRAR